ncbi:uncharacterized protein PGTG_10938 [Puccinia graminis f. sp. tritici CRL 75-36-700-3]|uniref:Uncharacterized protein n=1 Tax=Puccinia graminis f. sp. tritici (strain CRL 75-36-700-3 / race SCCL) TaxID=418459 RepID=E3KMX3_PUCGT|nr:uncharacterized protein PGTG_10938 [Puccinia graminis f. sp. tritici CRL 75-36-700-3]EFP85609.2 hypothetical protein PGTG_10938 [Puccinia graminis f. sp. tritici CRL 75-36-700-3]
MRDLGPTSAARKPFLASSGAAEQAADGRGGGSELPLAATFGSFGSSPSKLLQPTLDYGPRSSSGINDSQRTNSDNPYDAENSTGSKFNPQSLGD